MRLKFKIGLTQMVRNVGANGIACGNLRYAPTQSENCDFFPKPSQYWVGVVIYAYNLRLYKWSYKNITYERDFLAEGSMSWLESDLGDRIS